MKGADDVDGGAAFAALAEALLFFVLDCVEVAEHGFRSEAFGRWELGETLGSGRLKISWEVVPVSG